MPLFARTENLDDARNLHDEIQRKLVVIIVPGIVATSFLSQSAVSLWLGVTLWPVIVGLACIAGSFLISQLFVPLYQYLLVKGYPQKTLMMQSVNVSVNIILFVLCVPSLGYYGAVLAFCGAICASIGLAVRYQWSVLGSKVVATKEFAFKLTKLTVGLLTANILAVWMVRDDLPRVLVLMVANAIATVALLRILQMVSHSDIERYVGRSSLAGIVMDKLLVGGMA